MKRSTGSTAGSAVVSGGSPESGRKAVRSNPPLLKIIDIPTDLAKSARMAVEAMLYDHPLVRAVEFREWGGADDGTPMSMITVRLKRGALPPMEMVERLIMRAIVSGLLTYIVKKETR